MVPPAKPRPPATARGKAPEALDPQGQPGGPANTGPDWQAVWKILSPMRRHDPLRETSLCSPLRRRELSGFVLSLDQTVTDDRIGLFGPGAAFDLAESRHGMFCPIQHWTRPGSVLAGLGWQAVRQEPADRQVQRGSTGWKFPPAHPPMMAFNFRHLPKYIRLYHSTFVIFQATLGLWRSSCAKSQNQMAIAGFGNRDAACRPSRGRGGT
jgi:hypothetical protein